MFLRKPKYYRDCSELRAAAFFKILKTQDKSLLCYSGRPRQKEVTKIWSDIEIEYEKLTAGDKYQQQLTESNEECLHVLRNNGLILLYWKKKLAPDKDWSEDERYWDVDNNDADGIYTIIMREHTRHKINMIQNEELKKLKEQTQKPLTIERAKHYVELGLDKDYIDFEKISVLDWIDLCHLYTERAEATKSIAS
mgnify:CR=1 FL=1